MRGIRRRRSSSVDLLHPLRSAVVTLPKPLRSLVAIRIRMAPLITAVLPITSLIKNSSVLGKIYLAFVAVTLLTIGANVLSLQLSKPC